MLAFWESYKRPIIIIVVVIIACAGIFFRGYNRGYKAGYDDGYKSAAKAESTEGITVPAKVQTVTKTEFVYVPKEQDAAGQVENTDIDANLGKQELTVKVNGQEQTIHKSDNEKYVFDKNKLAIDQRSTATVDIKVPTVDNTRRWSVGIGYGNHGPAGKVDFPVGHVVGGWVAGDRQTIMAGVKVNF